MTPTAFAILGYLAVQFGIGLWASRRVRTEDDYLVAGRRLGYPLAICSIFATWFGAETCIGAAAEIYEHGFSWTSAEPFGYGLCIILMGLVFAGPLWRRRLTTLADLFRQRYGPRVERVAALVLIPTSLFWAAAQIRAFGHVVASTVTLDVNLAITVAAVFVILYTMVGGLLADAVTDLVQGAALTVGLVVAFVATVAHLGGPIEAMDSLRAAFARADPSPRPGMLETLEAWAVPVLGSVVATELVTRVIATRTDRIAVRASVTAGIFYVAVGLFPALMGLLGVALVPDLRDAEQLLPAVAATVLPAALYAVFAGALVSAILSTVDSTLLTASGLLSHNLLVPAMPGLGERAKVRLARGAVAAFGVIAWAIAIRSSGVMDLIEQASAFGSAGILVIVCFGMFTGFGGPRAALTALLGGTVAYVWGAWTAFPLPYLTSLAVALSGYVLVAGWRGAGSAANACD